MNIDGIVRMALPQIAIRLQNELVLNAPVDTGRLRNSIKVNVTKDGLKISLVNYARFVEFGCFFDEKTLIETIEGNKKLEEISVGDKVWTGNKYSKVIQKEEMDIGYKINKVTINFKNNKTLELTEDHPIFTDKGWKNAKDLKKGDKIKYVKTKY